MDAEATVPLVKGHAMRQRWMLLAGSLLALGAICGIASRRREQVDGGTLEVPWPLGMGSRAARMRRRVMSLLRGDWIDELGALEGITTDEQAEEADTGSVPFDWTFATMESGHVSRALALEGIETAPPSHAPNGKDILLADKLESSGIHLDEESRDEFTPVSRLHLSGSGSPRRLARAVERSLDTQHSGVIVDTSRNVVEIDEHRDVGRGNVLLIDESGASHLLRHGTMRSLVSALRAASERAVAHDALADDVATAELGVRPPTGLAQHESVHHQLSQLAPTIDGFVREIEHPGAPGVSLTAQLATRLGAVRRCVRCDTAIVEVPVVADVLARHYGAPHRREEIAAAIVTSAVETGHPGAPKFCHLHSPDSPSESS